MLEKLKEILQDYTDANLDNITEETNVKYDLGLDSLQFLSVATAIEDEFDVEISDEQANEIETVGDILNILK